MGTCDFLRKNDNKGNIAIQAIEISLPVIFEFIPVEGLNDGGLYIMISDKSGNILVGWSLGQAEEWKIQYSSLARVRINTTVSLHQPVKFSSPIDGIYDVSCIGEGFIVTCVSENPCIDESISKILASVVSSLYKKTK